MNKQTSAAVIGGTIWGNRGAEAMLVTTIGKLRVYEPDITIYIFSYMPDKDRKLINDERITILSNRPLDLLLWHFPFALIAWLFGLVRFRLPDRFLSAPIQALRQCDVLLDVSGISFADGREKLLPFNILNILPAMLLKVPVIKLAQAVGPFNNKLNRWAARFFFKRCYRIYARGRTTAAYLESLALPPEKWQLSADIAFLYEAAYSLSHENENKVNSVEKTLTDWQAAKHTIIGLAPSSLVYKEALKHDRDYVGHFIKLIDTMPEDTHYVLIPNATREGSDSTFNNDLIVIEAIQQAVAESAKTRVLAVDYDVNTAGSRRLVALCEVLVTSRFHAMISSLSSGIPPVVVGWSHKYAEVLAEFDLEAFALDFNQPNVDLTVQVQQILENKAAIQAQLAANLHTVQALATHQFDDVKGLLY